MGNYLHRTTKQYWQSISPASLPEPEANYIRQPDLSAVQNVPVRYWVIIGETVSAMSQAEQEAVDRAILQSNRDALVAQLEHTEDLLKAFASVMLDEINVLRNQHSLTLRTDNQLRTSIRNTLGT